MSAISFPPIPRGLKECGTSGYRRNLALAVFFIVFFGALSTLYPPSEAHNTETIITIEQGLGSRKIGALLKQEGVIRSKWAFVTYVSLRGEASLLKPGTYRLHGETIPRIAYLLVHGGQEERSVTIPEGKTSKDIAILLSQQGITTGGEFLARTETVSPSLRDQFPFLKELALDATLEGYLFPDTYRIFTNTDADSIIEKMLEDFGTKLTPDLQQEITRQNKTIFSVITMASLIEKEVMSDDDRAIISGIFWKRIALGMPLQADATILYSKGQSGKISIADTKIESPYNTYLHTGLPKGPIANPGLSAVKAAIYPKQSPYLYYLSTPGGRTIFSRTLDEHNTAKARYLR